MINTEKTIARALLGQARSGGGRIALADSSGAKVSFSEAVAKVLFLTGRLKGIWEGQERVGILVPPSVGGALLNWAAMIMGKVPVNLNYTLSAEGIASCIEQCGLTDVVASEKLMKKLKLDIPARVHLLEELVKEPKLSEKLRAGFLAKFCSVEGILRRLGGDRVAGDDLATIIFSSGSTGEPKGVLLTQRNVMTNLGKFDEVYQFGSDDRFLGVLPFFHSFGFVATIAGPAAIGFGAVYHFNPLEAKVIGPLIKEHGVTFMVATPTFLQFYVRSCEADQLASLRQVLASAEKLPDRLAEAFEKKFGQRPMEFYGSTECLAVTVNSKLAERRGSIGRALPGVELKVVDPDTEKEVESGGEGLLKVKSESVMRGYLGKEELTEKVMTEGWYETGDIVRIDEDGFVWIAGRLSRFSKIGGEMVPHGKVEEVLQELAGVTEQVFAVAGLPDERKGERLVVLHTLKDGVPDEVLEKLADADIPNLWKPKGGQFVYVESLPYLGTGKLDLKGLQRMAEEMA